MPKLERKRRNEYTRPCDECSKRKIKCDVANTKTGICSNCQHFQRSCKDKRGRLKSGPKPLNIFTSGCLGKVTLNELKLVIELYQTYLYRFWPFISSEEIITKMSSSIYKEGEKTSVILGPDTSMSYAVCCMLASTVSEAKWFDCGNYKLPHEPEFYFSEGRRVVHEYFLDMQLSVELVQYHLLCNFYLNSKSPTLHKGILCLKEAISTAYLLGLHLPETYIDKPIKESHQWRKLYYVLLIVERFQCFRFQCYQMKVDLLMEASIDFPKPKYDEYPQLLEGFIKLIKVFTSVDRLFFHELNEMAKSHHKDSEEEDLAWQLFGKFTIQSASDKLQKISSLQTKLLSLEPFIQSIPDDSQRLNVLLSKSWLQCLGWLKSSESNLLTQDVDYLSSSFPLKVAKEFLISTSGMSDQAHSSNGPGICLKMLQIVDSVSTFIKCDSFLEDWNYLGKDLLFSLVRKIDHFKIENYKIPQRVLFTVKAIEESRSVVKFDLGIPKLDEIFDEHESKQRYQITETGSISE